MRQRLMACWHADTLKLAYLVFSSTEQLSVHLQAVIQEALKGAELLVKSLRNDASFKPFYDAIYQECKDLTEEPCLPRYRKTPRRL